MNLILVKMLKKGLFVWFGSVVTSPFDRKAVFDTDTGDSMGQTLITASLY